jgi:hypothetical protein
MAKHENEFAENMASKLVAVDAIISREASLIRAHRWSEVNWNYLERKLPIHDVNRLFEIARREDRAAGKP